jgi:hypothetical protein
MKLLEILNFEVDIKWKKSGFQNFGDFEIDDKKCQVQIDEYEVLEKTLLDFGFTVDGSILASEESKPQTKLISAVYNVAKTKLKELDGDLILVSVMKNSGLVESRKSLYSTLARLLERLLGLVFDSGWIENSKGFFRIWSKTNLSKEEINLFISQVKDKD